MTLTQQPYNGVQIAAPYCKMSSLIKDDRKKAEIIRNIVSTYFGVPHYQMVSRGRKAYIVEARQMCMYFIRKYTRLSLKQTGNELGGLDHSTVIHAVETVKNYLSYDKMYTSKFNEVESKIKFQL
jgi:chromosomal replication initiator protein